MSLQSKTTALEGVMLVGTSPACGKTVITAGLASALIQEGFGVQAYKPLEFLSETALAKGLDQAYITHVSKQYLNAETYACVSPYEIIVPIWNRLIETCKRFQYPCLLEAPGQVATPWRIQGHRVYDCLDVAQELGIALLLVAKAGPEFMAETRSALTFIQHRGLQPAGFVRVETHPNVTDTQRDTAEPMQLTHDTRVPYIGHLPYSPSISVTTMQQGNLIRLTQENIDLLPLQMGIGLTL